jgi:tetratricopeptide (TPR) repeat protein
LEVIEEIQADLDNVWLAFDSALGRGAVELFTSAQASLDLYCIWVARNDEGIAVLTRAAAVLGELIAASPAPPADWLRLRADALCRQAHLTFTPEAGGPLLKQAGELLDQAESLGADARAERAHWHVRTSALKIDNDLSGAAEHARRSLALFRSLDDWFGVCIALDHLAYAEWWLGKFGAAADHLQEILALSGAHGDRAFAIWATGQLAIVHKVQARFDEAEAFDRQAIALSVALGRRWDEAGLTSNYADTLTAHGKFEDGLAMARRGLALYEALGRVDSWALANVAYPLLHLGRYADARAALLKALDSTSRALDLWIRGVVLLDLARVAVVERDYAAAEANLEHSQVLLAQSGRSDVVRPPIILAYLRRLQDGPAEATLAGALRLVLERKFARPPMALWPIAALQAADRGDLERAGELHALGQTIPYVANSRWFHDVAGRELDEIVARLPADVATAAIERGRKLDLWATAEALAAELAPT